MQICMMKVCLLPVEGESQDKITSRSSDLQTRPTLQGFPTIRRFPALKRQCLMTNFVSAYRYGGSSGFTPDSLLRLELTISKSH